MLFLNKHLDISNSYVKLFKSICTWTISCITVLFTVLPEKLFLEYSLFSCSSDTFVIVLNRFIFIIFAFIIIGSIMFINFVKKNKVEIKGKNYSIVVEYGDIFKYNKFKKIISFDECFTLTIGELPWEIKPNSLCGQYLKKFPLKRKELKNLMTKIKLKTDIKNSEFKNKTKYVSGRLIPRNDYLLLSFTKLDSNGNGVLTINEYQNSLALLWEEINKYYAQNDVCIPILGSGITRFEDVVLTKQELLDLIILSYKLSKHKIKLPNKLYIVCKKTDDFSLNKIGDTV